MIGCLLLGLFCRIDMPTAYRAIHWQRLILIVGMLLFALALRRTSWIEIPSTALIELAVQDKPER